MATKSKLALTVPAVASDEELRRLAYVFGLDPDASDSLKQLEPWLAAVATAALQEYVLAFAGTRAPSTMRELRELRLRLLYDHLAEDAPSDAQVAQMFGLTRPQARTLIAGTRARYRAELEGTLSERSVEALKNSTRVDNNTARVVLPESLAVFLDDLISETQAPPLEKNRDASRTYEIKRSTATALSKRLDFDVDQLKGFQQS